MAVICVVIFDLVLFSGHFNFRRKWKQTAVTNIIMCCLWLKFVTPPFVLFVYFLSGQNRWQCKTDCFVSCSSIAYPLTRHFVCICGSRWSLLAFLYRITHPKAKVNVWSSDQIPCGSLLSTLPLKDTWPLIGRELRWLTHEKEWERETDITKWPPSAMPSMCEPRVKDAGLPLFSRFGRF